MWAPDNSPKLKSLEDLSIMVNPEVTEEVTHHAGLRVDGSLHLHLHVCYHTRFLCQNQVLIICMTQDQLFHTYGQKCSQITKCHE
jgi:hypothetical protein